MLKPGNPTRSKAPQALEVEPAIRRQPARTNEPKVVVGKPAAGDAGLGPGTIRPTPGPNDSELGSGNGQQATALPSAKLVWT